MNPTVIWPGPGSSSRPRSSIPSPLAAGERGPLQRVIQGRSRQRTIIFDVKAKVLETVNSTREEGGLDVWRCFMCPSLSPVSLAWRRGTRP